MAAAATEEAGFWLPSEFLTDDDFLMGKENFNNELDTFPSEFPYHFETHTDHLLQKFCAMSTSPQSTPAYGSGGGSNRGSPFGAAKYDAVEDLIYLSAGHVAKLKLNRGYTENSCPLPRYPAQASSVYRNLLQFENISARAVGVMGEVAWAPHQIPSPRKTAFIGCGGGAAAKKASAGTGVFLPRRYDIVSDRGANSAGPRRRKQLASSSAFQGGAASAQLHTKPCTDYDTIYRLLHSQPQPHRRAFVSDHNSVLAQRHAVLLQQQLQLQLERRSFLAGELSMIGRDDQCLPREWTY